MDFTDKANALANKLNELTEKFNLSNEMVLSGDDIIEDVLAEFCIDENSNLRIQIDKRIDNLSQFDESSKRKTINYFLRRGFNYYDIIKSIEEYHKK